MRIGEWLKQAQHELQSVSDSAQLDAQLFLMDVLACDLAFLYREPDYPLSSEQGSLLESMLSRRKQSEPVAYILGHQAFWDVDLKVTPGTLIPRPETECLIEYIQSQYSANSCCKALDLGTGTGAIILILQKLFSSWSCCGVDQSKAALQVARDNAERLQLINVEWLCSNWFSQIKENQFDLIVSNPPYIDPADDALSALSYEPQSALTADEAGFADLLHIIQDAPNFLKPGGMLVLEHGSMQQSQLESALAENGFHSIHKGKDYAGLPRFLAAKCT